MATDNSSLQRILIVEDEENARKGYEALLRKWDCEVLGVRAARTRWRNSRSSTPR